MTFSGDTIAAIATAPGRGGVAVIRISGAEAFAIAQRLTGRKFLPGRIAVAKVVDPCGKTLDECVVLAFRSPRSYTGEDVIEFQCHGGTVTPRRLLEACLAVGARLAERGEFTARAFFNGRLPLDAAEGVIELVDAKTDRAADAALARLAGECGLCHRALYERAVDISTALEYALDVDETEWPAGYADQLLSRVRDLSDAIAAALARVREGHRLRDGMRVVLAGAPNAGKSSLLNALSGTNRAIVSDLPGTTRDVIETWLDIGGWPVCLTDTAGLRTASDAIEREGVARARERIADADVVVALDCDIEGAVRVHAKCDLDEAPAAAAVKGLRVSAKTGEGLDALRRTLAERLDRQARSADEPASDWMREASQLAEAHAAIKDVSDDVVLLANAVRTCAETLGRLVGAVYSDDLLDALFSRFCVGK